MIESAILAYEEFATWYAASTIAVQMAVTFAISVVASRIFAPNVPQAQQNNVRQQVPPDPTAGIPLFMVTHTLAVGFVMQFYRKIKNKCFM